MVTPPLSFIITVFQGLLIVLHSPQNITLIHYTEDTILKGLNTNWQCIFQRVSHQEDTCIQGVGNNHSQILGITTSMNFMRLFSGAYCQFPSTKKQRKRKIAVPNLPRRKRNKTWQTSPDIAGKILGCVLLRCVQEVALNTVRYEWSPDWQAL